MGSLGAFTTNCTFLNDIINTYTADHLVQILDKPVLCLRKNGNVYNPNFTKLDHQVSNTAAFFFPPRIGKNNPPK